MSSQKSTQPTKSPPVVASASETGANNSTTRASGESGSDASSNPRAPTPHISGALASLTPPGGSNHRASSSAAASAGLYSYPYSDAPISDELMVARACEEADNRGEGKTDTSKAQRFHYLEVDNGDGGVVPISDELMVARACEEADNRDEGKKAAAKTSTLRNNEGNHVLASNIDGGRIANAAATVLEIRPDPPATLELISASIPRTMSERMANNHEEAPSNMSVATSTPFEAFVVPEATALPDDLEAEGGQVPQVYDGVRVEINENNSQPCWKRRSTVGFVFVVIILIVTSAVLGSQVGKQQEPQVLWAPQPSSSPFPTNQPSASLQPTPTPSQLPTISPSLIPTSSSSPTIPQTSTPSASILPSLAHTSTPSTTVLPTLAPSVSPTFTNNPTFMLHTNCAGASLEKVFLEERCNGCFVYIAVDGTSAITTMDNDVRFYDLVDGSWNQTQLFTDVSSNGLIPEILGNVAVFGAPHENSGNGAVYIYERDLVANMWNLVTRIAPSDLDSGAEFGWSVAIDENVVVVGAWNDQVGGSTYVFRRNGSDGGWSQEAKLSPEDVNLGNFGRSVAVKGNTVVVGDNDAGIVFVYNYNMENSTWTQLQKTIHNDDCDFWFGSSVELTKDGELFIGCAGEDSQTGSVYHYIPTSGGRWYKMQQKITASDRQAVDIFGYWGQVSIDGNVMAVGAPGAPNGAFKGHVYIYARDSPSGSWMEVTHLIGPDGDTRFGDWVSLSGNKLLVGAYYRAYAYVLENC